MDLFDRIKKPAESGDDRASDGVDAKPPPAPLAERMRPATLADLVGQSDRLGPETPLGRAIMGDRAPSMVLWGPPGCGKTTVARLLAAHSHGRYQAISAVLAGVADVRAVIAQAEAERRAGRKTILFVDEIHRFNKAQQDALLPHVESGTVTLVGATTENPSFALTSALLSRCQVVRLEPLSDDAVVALLRRALGDEQRGLGGAQVKVEDDALASIARWADGDGRRALTLLEHLVGEVQTRGVSIATRADVEAAARDRTLRYDRAGEEHYNIVSAFIKSMRGSDPDAALYYCLRMISAGDDPLFVLRRMLIFAAEDVGMADPRALEVVAAADHAFQRVGLPEGLIPLSFAVTYLAVAPKSKAVYYALGEVQQEIEHSGALPVPMRLRNAPTAAMKAWGYGDGYRNPQADEAGFVPERYLPEQLADRVFYRPTSRGWETKVGEHLSRLRAAANAADAGADRNVTARQAAEHVARGMVQPERVARDDSADKPAPVANSKRPRPRKP